MLERPFQEVLSSGEPDFPFCLAWANESWSRRWLGEERDILQEQTYSFSDDARHAQWLSEVFADRRYIRVNGRPLFSIYRPTHLPNPLKTAEILREGCIKTGVGNPYLLGIDAHCSGTDCRSLGFDGTLVFAPQLGVLPDFMDDGPRISKLQRNLRHRVYSSKLKIYDSARARKLMRDVKRDFPAYPSVFVGWDNTPRRRENSIVIVDRNLEAFEFDLRDAMQRLSEGELEGKFVFLNAWNEWAEGNHLEPDLKNGRKVLQAVRRAFKDTRAAEHTRESFAFGSINEASS